jgi:uncharacterized damage-inducible protein DinB
MTSMLNDDLAMARQELDAARAELVAALTDLPADALGRSRRGGWTAQRVLQHVIDSEWHYAALVTQLRGLAATPPAGARDIPVSTVDAARMLTDARRALLAALDGIDEASYYRLGTVGREEYSVLSVLENATNHDREHAAQLRSIVATGT